MSCNAGGSGKCRQSSETGTLQWICKVRAEKVWTNFRSAARIKHNVVFVVYSKHCQIVISLTEERFEVLILQKRQFCKFVFLM